MAGGDIAGQGQTAHHDATTSRCHGRLIASFVSLTSVGGPISILHPLAASPSGHNPMIRFSPINRDDHVDCVDAD
ncbi:unnamed protein product [Cuscuta europaea]|uniref:Uncharacterized protein n=1 Tax=Cuscuta europaea TaxID=41803 RepID=A0A9P1E4M6_CUSEU|nr:unnamed protein product [Cuscuta europaea]